MSSTSRSVARVCRQCMRSFCSSQSSRSTSALPSVSRFRFHRHQRGQQVRWFSDDKAQQEQQQESETEKDTSEQEQQEESETDEQADEQEQDSEEVVALKAELASKDEEIAQLKDGLLRALAETENVRGRAQKDIDNAKQFANKKFAKEMLPVVDSLQGAFSNVPEYLREDDVGSEHADFKSMYDGVVMVEKVLISAFSKCGIEQIPALGLKFDYDTHEAVFQVPVPDKMHQEVIQVMRPGYTLNGRVLRSAQVGVADNPSKPFQEEDSEKDQ